MNREELPYHLIVSKTVASTQALKSNALLVENLDTICTWLLSNTSKMKDIFIGDLKLYICFSDRKAAAEFISLPEIKNLHSKWVKYTDSDNWYLRLTLE